MMTSKTKFFVFTMGLLISCASYINAGVFDILQYQLKTNNVAMASFLYTGGSNEQAIIALGFGLLYCLVGGFIAILGAHVYLIVCHALGIQTKFAKMLYPPDPCKTSCKRESNEK